MRSTLSCLTYLDIVLYDFSKHIVPTETFSLTVVFEDMFNPAYYEWLTDITLHVPVVY